MAKNTTPKAAPEPEKARAEGAAAPTTTPAPTPPVEPVAIRAGQDADPVPQAPDAEAAAVTQAAPANERLQTGTMHLAADQPGAPIEAGMIADQRLPDHVEQRDGRIVGSGRTLPRPELGGQAILVTGPKRGRWRSVGGRAVRIGVEPVRIAVAELSLEEAAAIRDDPVLAVLPAPKDT